MVIHEFEGLNDNIRDICRRFAEQGYAASEDSWQRLLAFFAKHVTGGSA